MKVLAAALLALLTLAAPAQAQRAFTPDYEARTFAKTQERFRFLTGTPAYQAELREKGAVRERQLAEIYAGDPERDMTGNLCEQRMDGCAGDVRFYDWSADGAGLALPVLWTARNGSTISGHVWATAEGPAKRPGVVITTGSVQAPEELYWFMAQTLAKAGYVVLTWDVQGQGYSDTYGEGADRNDGVPSQAGVPFYDGTEDALDFFLSTPQELFRPRRSCTTGTDHAPKQARRFAAGKVSGFNPFHALLDPSRVGSVGQSLGAAAVSYVGQLDPRFRAIVALDNLREPTGGPACASGSSPRPARIAPTKPALGMAGDYGLVVTPNTSQPNADAKAAASKALSAAGVDTGEVVIRGGTHYEFDVIPNPAFPATLRGMDMTAWYVRAWMDRYVGGRGAAADAALRTDRWRSDPRDREVDPAGEGNLFSEYYRSRLDVRTSSGERLTCELLETACPLRPDGLGGPYEALADAYRKDGAGPGAEAARPWVVSTAPAGAAGVPPAANRLPAGTPAAAAACRDAERPTSRPSRRTTSRRLVLRGTAADTGCTEGGRLVRVLVAVGLERGRSCRWLRPNGTLGRPASCRRTPYVPAEGTSRWRFAAARALPKGRYKVWTRAVDAAGNLERKAARRNFARLRLR